LADLNGIASHQRTAFQARLKNLHRLGFPQGIGQGRGKAIIYGARELLLMAVAVELAQVGLTPERIIEVIQDDEYPLWMAVHMAASALHHRPQVFREGFSYEWADQEDTDPTPFFLFLDPSTLAPWNDDGEDRASGSFSFGGLGVVRENLARWTTGPSRRLALINVTALVGYIAAYLGGPDGALAIVKEIDAVADGWIRRDDFELDDWLLAIAKPAMLEAAANPQPFVKDGKRTIARLSDVVDLSLPYVHLGPSRHKTLPDMLIRLPGQRELIVDGRMGLLADIPQESIYARVDELAEQPFRTMASDRTNYQVMFVGDDWFLSAAAAHDKDIFEDALSKGVVIATPSALKAMMQKIAELWKDWAAGSPERRAEWDALAGEEWPHEGSASVGDDQEA
jgi:hypothetical protein